MTHLIYVGADEGQPNLLGRKKNRWQQFLFAFFLILRRVFERPPVAKPALVGNDIIARKRARRLTLAERVARQQQRAVQAMQRHHAAYQRIKQGIQNLEAQKHALLAERSRRWDRADYAAFAKVASATNAEMTAPQPEPTTDTAPAPHPAVIAPWWHRATEKIGQTLATLFTNLAAFFRHRPRSNV